MARTIQEVEQSEIATLVVESNLTDTNESARAAATVGAHARQVVTIEQSIGQMALSFGLGGFGTNLRDRCAQIPGFVVDIGDSPASGAVLAMVRDDSSGELVVPAGSSVSTSAGVVYVTASDLVFLDGELNYPATGQSYGVVIATVPGTAGNCDAGAIVTPRSMPAGVISVTNPVALTNGLNAESDAQLKKRALDYISGGISQQTPAGLRALALQFRASDGTRCRHAVVSQDPTRPYSTLIVDDGNGFVGFTRPAVETGGTVPDGNQLQWWFESPAASNTIPLYVNGVGISDVTWTAIQERGVAFLDASSTVFSPGDTWTSSGFQVHFGFIAELQRVIEGVLAYQGISVGYRSTGTRVRVMAPFVEMVEFDALVTYASGFDPNQVNVAFRSAIVQFMIALAPGSPLLVAHLIARLDRVPGVLNHSLRNPGDTALAMPDRWPANLETRLSTATSQIKINGVVG